MFLDLMGICSLEQEFSLQTKVKFLYLQTLKLTNNKWKCQVKHA